MAVLTLRAKPTVKPPTPSPATRGLVSTPNVPNSEKPAKVYIAMAADFDANLQPIHAKSAWFSPTCKANALSLCNVHDSHA